MAEYIERDAAIATIQNIQGPILSREVRTLREIPAADVVEVKHGRWETVIDCDEFWGELDYYKCSLCGKMELRDSQTLYCPNCGAKMDGDG